MSPFSLRKPSLELYLTTAHGKMTGMGDGLRN
jgi:hypothetical protein